MKILKKIGLGFLVVLILANIAVVLSGNNHLYKGLADTYFQGRTKPSIDDPDIFYARILKSKSPRAWEESKLKNSVSLSDTLQRINKRLETKALLIIYNNEIIHESYYDGYDKNKVSNSFSMAKTILSIVTGIAIKEGKVSVEDRVVDYLPDFIQKKDSALKVKHLLTMTSGMNFKESYGNPFGFMAKAYYGTDLKALVKGYELNKKPGVEHKYLGGNNLLLSFLLEKAIGEKVGDYASRNLWEKLGMENDAKWVLDDEGGDEKTFTGVFATARDFAKIGRLFMNNGFENGEQIIDSTFVIESLTPIDVLDDDGKLADYYGYSWWFASYKGKKVFYMRGILGQYVICVPSENLIITRLGQFREKTKLKDGATPDDIWAYLEEGFRLIE